ncbi:ribonuclease HIII [Lactococcus hircilactis]|uniref:Ribonuclease HIII n=1 Tax=Lactococcus hircilactis TaxID=1494462 RepID=A0A7X1ZAC8_9LACT|nr:ribonuclease HIII [Lactococcus hircilactis]MQW40683.1 ribonuclease HIII [Lactococcus hircilactis]
MNVVLTLDEKTIQSLIKKFATHQRTTKNQYLRFYANVGGVSISVYTSGKVVFQGSDAEKCAHEFGYQTQKISARQDNCIGTDEVGNGSYFGSLVVVASFVSTDSIPLLKKWGVADSKKVTDEKICQLAPKLRELLPHVQLIVEPKKYNQVIEQGYNAVSIKVALHNQAIYLLEKKLTVDAEQIIIDAFTTTANYEKYVKKEKNQVTSKITLLPKAEDQFLAVAASSIMARAAFLDHLGALSKKARLVLPSGAGASSDRIAAKIIQRDGISALNEYAKVHFANTQKASQLAQK